MACQRLGKLVGLGDLIACDMGGTSFEACLLPGGEPTFTNLEELEYGVPIALTMVDARSIGAGGGSIAWVDAAGILRVGPTAPAPIPARPATARRDPADRDRTRTRCSAGWRPSSVLAGDFELDFGAAETAVDPLAEPLGLDRVRVAQGIVDVANNNMAQALRLVSTDRGYDPRGATLVAYGGAGPLHACELRARSRSERSSCLGIRARSRRSARCSPTPDSTTRPRTGCACAISISSGSTDLRGARAPGAEEFAAEGFSEPRRSSALDRPALRRPELGADGGDAGRRR